MYDMQASYAAACYLNCHGQSRSSLHATTTGYYQHYVHPGHGMNAGVAIAQQHHTGKRTRRGGRGRTRRRGRKGCAPRVDVSIITPVETPETASSSSSSSSSSYPWWYDHMIKSGRTPAGVSPSTEDGFPVILPSTQCVYLLPHAKNPHRASTYVPLEDRSRDEVAAFEDEDDETIFDGEQEDDLEKHIPSCLLEEDCFDEDDATSLASESEESLSLSSLGSRGGPTQWQFDDISSPSSTSNNGGQWLTPFDQKTTFIDLKEALDEIGDDLAVVSDHEGDDDDDNVGKNGKKRHDEVFLSRAPRVTFED